MKIRMENKEKYIIGVCDDQEEVLWQLRQMIEEICTRLGLDVKVRIFLNEQELLSELENISILFLDIEMPRVDGIALGRIVKEKCPACKIIMATGNVKRFKEAFQIQAMRFVTKPFISVEVEEALVAATECNIGNQYMVVYQQRNKIEVQQAQVCYIEAYNGYAEFVVDGRIFRRDNSLDELEKELDDRLFVRINRKTIVNLRYVKKKGTCIWIGDREMEISRRKKKLFECKYIEFDLRYRRSFG